MAEARLTDIDIGRFKSYEGQSLPILPLTLLIGRNGSGKSNALDAITLLALLADGRDLGDLERGDKEVAGLRGGLSGSAPFGQGMVEVGVSVDLGDRSVAELSMTLDPTRFEVDNERLVLREPGRQAKTLFEARRTEPGSGLAEAQVYSGGAPKAYQMLAGRMICSQAVSRIPTDSKSRKLVVDTAATVVSVLTGIFVLDPVPAEMREYTRLGVPPDRSGASLSAQLHALRSDGLAWERLIALVTGLVGANVRGLTFAEGRLPVGTSPVDVMVALVEQTPSGPYPVPATQMSDGTLRYLSILASLLSLRMGSRENVSTSPRTMVIEEIENGLFPDQAERVLQLLREEARQEGVTLIATTHSPALLDAVNPSDHEGIVICERDEQGRGTLSTLVDHPRYLELVQNGHLGQALTRGELSKRPTRRRLSIAEALG